MKNKLGYLGFLGFIGLLGIWWGSFTYSSFLVFFFFFSYAKVIPDELFKENIKKSALSAFVVNSVINIVIIAALSIHTNLYQYTQVNSNSLLYGFTAFVLNFVVSILTFVFVLIQCRHKEKELLE